MEDYTYKVINSGTASSRTLKRKCSDEETPRSKRRRFDDLDNPSKDTDFTYSGRNSGPACSRVLKRKSCDEEMPQSKRRRCDVSAKPSKSTGGNSIITISSSCNSIITISSSSNSIITISSSSSSSNSSKKEVGLSQETQGRQESSNNERAEFEAKYREQYALKAGGFGQVFAGLRKADNLPVAIKHIPKEDVTYTQLNGHQIPLEVAIMQRLSAGRAGSEAASAPVALLDWYQQNDELILVMERPVPCIDLMDYANQHEEAIKEEQVQVIVKQLAAALLELEHQKVFHRDIKLENILLQNGGDGPRARVIDFGLSAIAGRGTIFTEFSGTECHIPPEWKMYHTYSSGPATVWQLGVLAYEMLHRTRFETNQFLAKKLTINKTLSQDCQTFLNQCLTTCPFQRSSLERLQNHPWLQ